MKASDKKHIITEEEFENIAGIIHKSLLAENTSTGLKYFKERELLVAQLSLLLKQMLDSKIMESGKQKLELIDLIDKLNLLKERLEVANSKAKLADIKIAGNRLGKKAQSAFKGK